MIFVEGLLSSYLTDAEDIKPVSIMLLSIVVRSGSITTESTGKHFQRNKNLSVFGEMLNTLLILKYVILCSNDLF